MNVAINAFLGIIGALLFAIGFVLLIPGIYFIVWEAFAGTSIAAFLRSDHYFNTIVSFAEGAFVMGLGFMLILWAKPQHSSK